jgi:hypothetical protein
MLGLTHSVLAYAISYGRHAGAALSNAAVHEISAPTAAAAAQDNSISRGTHQPCGHITRQLHTIRSHPIPNNRWELLLILLG